MAENYFLRLPFEVLEYVFTYLPYDTISSLRLVSKMFDQLSQQRLNLGFSKVDKYHAKIQKLVKAKLPRRESERRNHPLAKHVNALSAIETRLSLMNMTYMKYIDMGLCCFIPGRVLDEMFKVLRALEDTCTQPRTHELLQELRDISSMAMEHFEEKIVPIIKKNNTPVTIALSTSLPVPSPSMTPGIGGVEYNEISWSTPPAPSVRQPAIRQEIQAIRSSMRATSSSVLALKKDLSDGNRRSSAQQKKLFEMEKKLQDQTKIISEQSKKITEHDARIYRLRQSILEYDVKFNQVHMEMCAIRRRLGLEDCLSDSCSSSSGPWLSVSAAREAEDQRERGSRSPEHKEELTQGAKQKSLSLGHVPESEDNPESSSLTSRSSGSSGISPGVAAQVMSRSSAGSSRSCKRRASSQECESVVSKKTKQ